MQLKFYLLQATAGDVKFGLACIMNKLLKNVIPVSELFGTSPNN